MRNLYEWMRYGGRIPRKLKKRIIGTKIRKKDLKMMLNKTILGLPAKTMFETVECKPYGLFCPKCGEKGYIGSGNKTTYPEHWEYFNCIRCKTIVGYIDNSPFIHALECKEYNYNPVF